jgi:hypothetical protein
MAEASPPKPRLTLRVGITGHRPNKLPQEALPRIDRQLREVIAAIETVTAGICDDNKAVYSDAPAPGPDGDNRRYRIRMISGFAEGADQMAVAACPNHWTIEAVLPFPKAEYLKDFARSAAGDERDVTAQFEASLKRAAVVTEIPTPRSAPREQGYVTSGSFMLRQIDLLIAVWDGEAPKPGGTGAIAKEACEGGIPVVWIPTGGEQPISLIAAFKDDQPLRAAEDWSEATLKGALDPILAAPSADAFGRRRSPLARLEQFYGEAWRPFTRASTFDLIKRWTTGQRPVRLTVPSAPIETLEANFKELVEDAPDAGPLSQRLKDMVAPRYAWADHLAVHFSHLYRNAYVLAYLLAACAVLIAVLGAYVETPALKVIFVGLELMVVVVIIQLVRHGHNSAWHERWIDYRLIAESLRHARYLAYVSEFGLIQQRDVRDQPWTIWYIRATLRELGLPDAVLDRSYQRPLLQSMLRHEVQAQRHWHETNADMMHKVDHVLHHWADRCFHLTFLALTIGLVALIFIIGFLPEQQEHHLIKLAKPWLLLFAAGLPALGAALAGIRVQGGFDDSKERSERMIGELNALEGHCEALLAQQAQLDRTASTLIETARVMSEDLAAWQQLYGRKRLTLPA